MKDLSLHILDIFQNSIRASAGAVTVELSYYYDGLMALQISDDGKGMNEQQLNQVRDPFFTTRTTRKIGLGVSLLAQKAEQSGGFFSIESLPEEGTIVKAGFQIKHPDCPPLGDIPECAWILMASNPGLKIIFKFRNPIGEWDWDSVEISNAIGDISKTENKIRIGIIDWFNTDFSNFKENIAGL
jgi:hypothetical protein